MPEEEGLGAVEAAEDIFDELKKAQKDPLRDEKLPEGAEVPLAQSKIEVLSASPNELKKQMHQISSILEKHEIELPERVDSEGRPRRSLFTGGVVRILPLEIADDINPEIDVGFTRHPDDTYTTTIIWAKPDFREGGAIRVPGGISGIRYELLPPKKAGEQTTVALDYERLTTADNKAFEGWNAGLDLETDPPSFKNISKLSLLGDVQAQWHDFDDPGTPQLKPEQSSRVKNILTKVQTRLQQKFQSVLPPSAYFHPQGKLGSHLIFE